VERWFFWGFADPLRFVKNSSRLGTGTVNPFGVRSIFGFFGMTRQGRA